MKTKAIFVILVTLFMGCLVFNNNAYAGRQDIVNLVDRMIAEGVITHIEYADYYVNEYAWAVWDAQTKKNFAFACAVHYLEKGGGAERSEIYGSHSGKKLAKWGAFGFKIY